MAVAGSVLATVMEPVPAMLAGLVLDVIRNYAAVPVLRRLAILLAIMEPVYVSRAFSERTVKASNAHRLVFMEAVTLQLELVFVMLATSELLVTVNNLQSV